MLPTTHRTDRSTIPATGLGSILVVVPQLALEADRGVVAEVAVAVGMGEGSFSAVDRRPWTDVTATAGGTVLTGTAGMTSAPTGIDRGGSEPDRDGVAAPTTTASEGTR